MRIKEAPRNSRSDRAQPPKLLLVTVCLAGFAAGCVHVAPYEREYLARPSMDLEREGPQETFRGHIYDSREGAMGSSNSAGGGCGCN